MTQKKKERSGRKRKPQQKKEIKEEKENWNTRQDAQFFFSHRPGVSPQRACPPDVTHQPGALLAPSVQKKTEAVARLGLIFPVNGPAYLLLPAFAEVERENLVQQATANAARNSGFRAGVNSYFQKKGRRVITLAAPTALCTTANADFNEGPTKAPSRHHSALYSAAEDCRVRRRLQAQSGHDKARAF